MGITNDDAVANFDETNVYFAPTIDTIIDNCGARTVSIQFAKLSNWCTAMLGCTLGGTKMIPLSFGREKTPLEKRFAQNASALIIMSMPLA